MPRLSLWLSQPQFAYVEIAYACGVRRLVLDIEHGLFPLTELDSFLGFTKALGMSTLAKVASPTAEAIQQALDCGADGVIVPHITDADHAARVCATAKFPPQGTRSYYGGRPVGFKRPDDAFFEAENRRVSCYPMIETATSLEDVERIAALDVVDGLFPGPSDLSLSCGRGSYRFDDVDRAAIVRCARAAQAVGKSWIFPAWTAPERALALSHGAQEIVFATQFMVIRGGIQAAQQALRAEGLVDA